MEQSRKRRREEEDVQGGARDGMDEGEGGDVGMPLVGVMPWTGLPVWPPSLLSAPWPTQGGCVAAKGGRQGGGEAAGAREGEDG